MPPSDTEDCKQPYAIYHTKNPYTSSPIKTILTRSSNNHWKDVKTLCGTLTYQTSKFVNCCITDSSSYVFWISLITRPQTFWQRPGFCVRSISLEQAVYEPYISMTFSFSAPWMPAGPFKWQMPREPCDVTGGRERQHSCSLHSRLEEPIKRCQVNVLTHDNIPTIYFKGLWHTIISCPIKKNNNYIVFINDESALYVTDSIVLFFFLINSYSK